MENTRRSDGETGHNTQTVNNNQRKGAPTGFEGMNFEQQRGSYNNSDRGSAGRRDGRNGPEDKVKNR